MVLELLLAVLPGVLAGRDEGLPDGLGLNLPVVELADGIPDDLRHLLDGHLHRDAPIGLVRSLGPLFLQEPDAVLEVAFLDDSLDLLVCCKVANLMGDLMSGEIQAADRAQVSIQCKVGNPKAYALMAR